MHIGSGSFIRGEGGLIIEDNVIISRNAVIYSTSHNYNGSLLPFDHTLRNNQVKIGKNSWIGMNVTISPGTIIGKGCIIALGTRVYGKIVDYAIVGSNEPTILGFRNVSKYKYLDKNECYAKEDGLPLNQMSKK